MRKFNQIKPTHVLEPTHVLGVIIHISTISNYFNFIRVRVRVDLTHNTHSSFRPSIPQRETSC